MKLHGYLSLFRLEPIHPFLIIDVNEINYADKWSVGWIYVKHTSKAIFPTKVHEDSFSKPSNIT